MIRFIVIGIDPGVSGGIVELFHDEVFTYKLDNTEKDIAEWLAMHSLSAHAFIESVHSMPKQGVASSFKFGKSYGFLRGLLIGLKIPFEEVSPQKWQKELACLTKGNKNVSKARAQQLFPHEKITHALADALLIAEYGRRTMARRNGQETDDAAASGNTGNTATDEKGGGRGARRGCQEK